METVGAGVGALAKVPLTTQKGTSATTPAPEIERSADPFTGESVTKKFKLARDAAAAGAVTFAR